MADLEERVLGALLGLACGDALGATVEFMSPEQIAAKYGVHREISGGGAFGWRPGQGTDDTDMMMCIARSYAEGYTLDDVGQRFVAWYRTGPPDVGATTRSALSVLARSGDPTTSGLAHASSAGNGSLMRCLPTGLVRADPLQRGEEARAISAITHAEPRCLAAVTQYCDLVDGLLRGYPPDELASLADDMPIADLDASGYVESTLRIGLWALFSELSFEDALVEVVNRGDDADTNAAVAGGLLGARFGAQAIPHRWVDKLEYRAEIEALAPRLTALRGS